MVILLQYLFCAYATCLHSWQAILNYKTKCLCYFGFAHIFQTRAEHVGPLTFISQISLSLFFSFAYETRYQSAVDIGDLFLTHTMNRGSQLRKNQTNTSVFVISYLKHCLAMHAVIPAQCCVTHIWQLITNKEKVRSFFCCCCSFVCLFFALLMRSFVFYHIAIRLYRKFTVCSLENHIISYCIWCMTFYGL